MRTNRAFSLLELLVAIAVMALLIAIMIPALGDARRQAKTLACGVRLRELGNCLQMYANDYDARCLPLAYWSTEIIGDGPTVFWWGTNDAAGVNHERGFVWPYLQSPPGVSSVFECPEQPWGSYRPQGAAGSVTSTYGYNGYYLSPPHTPGWGAFLQHLPWLDLSEVQDAAQVFAFADTLIDLGAPLPHNTALLDPARVFTTEWQDNSNPTTAFRHRGLAQAVHVDGHVAAYPSQPDWLSSHRFTIGSVGGLELAPHYVPTWRRWQPASSPR